MNHSLSVTGTVLIYASPAQVWQTLTDPEIIKEYLHGTETLTDWQPGSEIIFQGEYQGFSYRDKGAIKTNRPLQEISYSYWSGFSGLPDTPENYSEVKYLLREVGPAQTELNWIQTGYPSEERQKHSSEGMDAFMQQIKAIAERE